MRRPRLRCTVRRMILLVAVLALALFLAREFRDGLPPRFVVDGIPRRIERLRPGMTWTQTRDILGLERSWLRGGTDARFFVGTGNGHYSHESYNVRPMRTTVVTARVRGGPPGPVKIVQSRAWIEIEFRTEIESTNRSRNDLTRLRRAAFGSDGRTIAEMPGSR